MHEHPGTAGGLAEELAQAKRTAPGGPDTWNPPFCGNIDMRIAKDGTWYYMGTPIERRPLVKLFAGVLRREGDAYFLVTPVEKVGIAVDDAPFMAVRLDATRENGTQTLTFRTNLDHIVACGPNHPLRIEVNPETGEPSPYVLVRAGLWARLARPVFYELVELAELEDAEGGEIMTVESRGARFVLGSLDGLA